MTALAWGCSVAEGACPELWPHTGLGYYSLGQPEQSPSSPPALQDPSPANTSGQGLLPSRCCWRAPVWTRTLRCCADPKGKFQGSFCSCFLCVSSFPSVPFPRCTDTGVVRLGADTAPVTWDFCTSAQGTAFLRFQHGENHFHCLFHSSPMPCWCWDPSQLPSCALWVRVSCRNHSTHGEGDRTWMGTDITHTPSPFPSLSPLV